MDRSLHSRTLRPRFEPVARVVVGRRRSELLQCFSGITAECLRNPDLEGDDHVPGGAVATGGALAPNTQLAPVLCTRWDLHCHREAADGGYPYVRAQRRLGNRHRDGDGHVVAAPTEHGVLLHMDDDIQVSVRATVLTRCALALDANLLPVVHTAGDA